MVSRAEEVRPTMHAAPKHATLLDDVRCEAPLKGALAGQHSSGVATRIHTFEVSCIPGTVEGSNLEATMRPRSLRQNRRGALPQVINEPGLS